MTEPNTPEHRFTNALCNVLRAAGCQINGPQQSNIERQSIALIDAIRAITVDAQK